MSFKKRLIAKIQQNRKTAEMGDDEVIAWFENSDYTIDDVFEPEADFIAPIDSDVFEYQKQSDELAKVLDDRGYFDGWEFFKKVSDDQVIPYVKATKKEYANALRQFYSEVNE